MKKNLIIADISSIYKDDNIYGHYKKVANMYYNIFKDDYNVRIAGGPIYRKNFKNCEQIMELPYDMDVDYLYMKKQKILLKIKEVINGYNLFKNTNEAIIICQPYSFISWMLCILLFSKNNSIYLIEYKNEIKGRCKSLLYSLTKKKVTGVICPNQEVGKAYNKSYYVISDYIYMGDFSKRTKKNTYDFGMIGIISKGKDLEDVIKVLGNTNYKVLIAGYVDPEYKQSIDRIPSNITLINKYLTDEEYESLFDAVSCHILPYKDDYIGQSSGVIYDVLFHGKPIITKDYPNFKFVESEHLGVLYRSSLKNVDFEKVLSMISEDKYIKNIYRYLLKSKQNIEKLKKWIQ